MGRRASTKDEVKMVTVHSYIEAEKRSQNKVFYPFLLMEKAVAKTKEKDDDTHGFLKW